MSRVLPILFLLVAGALFFGYIHPTVMGPIAEKRAEIKKYDAALTAAKRFEQKQLQLQTEVKALPPDGVARLEEFLPDSVDNVQLILDLDGLAARSGIKIEDFNTPTPSLTRNTGDSELSVVTLEDGKPYESLDVNVSAVGSYSQFRSFLSGVESSLRPLDLVALQVTDSLTGIYKYDMTLRIYWLR